MSSETESNKRPATSIDMELDLGDNLPTAKSLKTPRKATKKVAAKKAAKKVARKATKRVAKKAVSKTEAPEAAPAPAPVAEPVAKKVEATPEETPKPKPAAKRVARKRAVKDEVSDFRPTDFKGRGSHFDGVEEIQVARESKDYVPTKVVASSSSDEGGSTEKVVAEKSEPTPSAPKTESSAEGESPERSSEGKTEDSKERSDGRRPNNRRERNDDSQRERGDNRRDNRHGKGKNSPRDRNANQNQGDKRGNQRNNPKAKGGNRKERFPRNGASNWSQPKPPSQVDDIEGELPALERFTKFDAVAELATGVNREEALIDVSVLYELKLDELIVQSEALGLSFEEKPGRKQIIEELFKSTRESKKAYKDVGFLDLTDAGHGFVVHQASNYQLKPESVYVPAALIKHFSLKRGHEIEVVALNPEEGERCPAAVEIVSVMGGKPEDIAKVTPFEDLIPYYPTNRLVLETPMPSNSKADVSMRAFDLLTPIGYGQRGLIVAPPRTGKTVLLQGLANSVMENCPDAHLIVLLIDERPEEVTDFKRKINAEIISSPFDETPTSHVHATEMVGDKARRMVEQGKHVIILLDSITRLARAYNALASNSGKIMSGGIEATAMQKPKRFFGAARNIEGAGSLTIMGTALVDTGSKMDEVIFEEFKGTGNMEIHLDRDLINKRIFPAISFERSGTRKEELLYHPIELEKVYGLRRVMQGVPGVESMEMLIKRLKATKSNAEFLMSLK